MNLYMRPASRRAREFNWRCWWKRWRSSIMLLVPSLIMVGALALVIFTFWYTRNHMVEAVESCKAIGMLYDRDAFGCVEGVSVP